MAVAASSQSPRQGAKGRAASQTAERLLAWYDRHARRLPWRAPPGQAAMDPYRVWLSEIMLQQTTVAAVGPYFEKFLRAWPTVADLAAAPLDDVLAVWAGLGYYARARNLHRCARVVAQDLGGRFPEDEDALRELPGIGPYTAAAVAAIAFDRRATVVDGNVERVVARLFAVETPLPQAKGALRGRAADLTPNRRPGDFAQSMMDLGATVCLPRAPKCMLCPLAEDCAGRRRGLAEALPYRTAKPARPTRRAVAFVASRGDGALLLQRRPERGLLGGMMEVPSTPWQARLPGRAAAEAQAPMPATWRPLSGRVTHTFTHFHFEVTVWAGRVDDHRAAAAQAGGGRWVLPDALAAEALPTVMRKIIDHALRQS